MRMHLMAKIYDDPELADLVIKRGKAAKKQATAGQEKALYNKQSLDRAEELGMDAGDQIKVGKDEYGTLIIPKEKAWDTDALREYLGERWDNVTVRAFDERMLNAEIAKGTIRAEEVLRFKKERPKGGYFSL